VVTPGVSTASNRCADQQLLVRELPPGAQRPRRHRIEHCQTVREEQLELVAAHQVLASFFVKHVYYWGDAHRDRFLGPYRAARISPLAAARRFGVPFGLHSDAPVSPVPPLEGMWCAVTRTTRDGAPLGPEQSVDVEAALRAYTRDAARLAGDDHVGHLVVGGPADLVVLGADPTRVDAASLRDIPVDLTVAAGAVAHQRQGS
jgi:predicted amidohydrolase YtcJ